MGRSLVPQAEFLLKFADTLFSGAGGVKRFLMISEPLAANRIEYSQFQAGHYAEVQPKYTTVTTQCAVGIFYDLDRLILAVHKSFAYQWRRDKSSQRVKAPVLRYA